MLRSGLWGGFIPPLDLLPLIFSPLQQLSLFSLFPFLKNGFLTVTLPWRPFLMRLGPTADGLTEGPGASLRSCVWSLLEFLLFLKDITFRHCSSLTFWYIYIYIYISSILSCCMWDFFLFFFYLKLN